jgi:hypothetical protein
LVLRLLHGSNFGFDQHTPAVCDRIVDTTANDEAAVALLLLVVAFGITEPVAADVEGCLGLPPSQQ